MNSTVIAAQNLSKRYRIGVNQKRKDTLFGQLTHMLKTPLQNLKKIRSMTRFDQDDESVFWALKDINFEVREGEVLGIIGHNGAGKSTLLKLLSKITEPTTGRIDIHGRIAALLEVGTGFHQDLTGRENIYMNGTILGMTRKEIDRKLDEIIDFSGVEKYIDTPVKFYSSGMKVRLGFSVAAHLEPEILVIDEVLAVGDIQFQNKCLKKMESVSGSGRTVLFVSHNMGSVRSLCTRAMVLNQGQIMYKGDVTEAVSQYYSLNYKDLQSGQEIPEALSTHYTGEAKIRKFRILDETRTERSSFSEGDSITFEFTVEAMESIKSALLDIRFISTDYVEAGHISNAYDEHMLNLKKGVNIIILSFRCPFQPGIYSFHLGVHHANGYTIDYIENVGNLDISAKHLIRPSMRSGVISLNAHWET